MADDAVSAETMLVGLQDIRLPAEAPGGLAAELIAVIGLGLVLALAVSVLLKLVTRPPPKPAAELALADRIAALAALPEEDRALALLSLIRATAPDALPGLRASLYRRGGFPEAARLEAVLMSRMKADA
ncbi:hypothetical protein [Hoeflea ulvae]|uniref:Uncharacterized protein n=1 Tax=Hoeflea ulvae TaxID=2983764 RepID=A0ABT3YL81_9HYPH|nr:hypothetical protein [Hoeflea ulvae]MCY0096495.1 hypothetical protein [Hoeflea ulvae]